MSTFQEFGPLSERRRAELYQKRRKKIMIAGASVSVILILAVVGVAAINYRNNANSVDSDSTKTSKASSKTKPSSELRSSSKPVTIVCAPTDYKETCESSLNKAIKNGSAVPTPKDLVKAAVSVVFDEVEKAFAKVVAHKSEEPSIKGAVDVCKTLSEDAEEELKSTIDIVAKSKVEDLPNKSALLRNWLSAVMSYQATCIDAFPEGDLKSSMKEGMETAKELTSNALAIIGKASKLASATKSGGADRRLLAEEEKEPPEVGDDGMPTWLSESDRRLLKGKATENMEPDVTVAKDGSGQFKTINEALAAMPKERKGRYKIYLKEGIYDEYVEVTKNMANVTIFGDGSRKSVITGKKNYVDGTKTFMTASFAAVGEGFMAIGLGFQNTAGPEKHQAVALRVQSDLSVFLNCRFEGYQDTLYAQTHRQYYRSCVIVGTIDFIFGDAAAVFQNCVLQVRLPMKDQFNAVTAHGRVDRQESTGFILHSCKFVPEPELESAKKTVKSYIGRPWKVAARVVVMESEIADFISPEGYKAWEGVDDWTKLFYGEYKNTGPGASTTGRVKWAGFKVITNKQEAIGYTVADFIQGTDWIKNLDAPVRLGLFA